jgi:hypothetical protein
VHVVLCDPLDQEAPHFRGNTCVPPIFGLFASALSFPPKIFTEICVMSLLLDGEVDSRAVTVTLIREFILIFGVDFIILLF